MLLTRVTPLVIAKGFQNFYIPMKCQDNLNHCILRQMPERNGESLEYRG
jgi:hypothetical protein